MVVSFSHILKAVVDGETEVLLVCYLSISFQYSSVVIKSKWQLSWILLSNKINFEPSVPFLCHNKCGQKLAEIQHFIVLSLKNVWHVLFPKHISQQPKSKPKDFNHFNDFLKRGNLNEKKNLFWVVHQIVGWPKTNFFVELLLHLYYSSQHT